MTIPKIESYPNVWDAIADTPLEVGNLRVRSELMNKITALIEKIIGLRPRLQRIVM